MSERTHRCSDCRRGQQIACKRPSPAVSSRLADDSPPPRDTPNHSQLALALSGASLGIIGVFEADRGTRSEDKYLRPAACGSPAVPALILAADTGADADGNRRRLTRRE